MTAGIYDVGLPGFVGLLPPKRYSGTGDPCCSAN